MSRQPEDVEGNWESGLLRIFVTHTHAQRELAGDLKRALYRFGIDAFVAHDDIAPTREWENEIITALNSCTALIALLSEDAPASKWVDQESGWAMARDLPIISVDLGTVPYGFLGRYQALQGRSRSASDLASEVFRLLLANRHTYWTLVDALVTSFERSGSFSEANYRFDLLQSIPRQGLSEEQLDRIEKAFEENSQVAGAFTVQNYLQSLVRSHREAWEEFWEEERRAQLELDQ